MQLVGCRLGLLLDYLSDAIRYARTSRVGHNHQLAWHEFLHYLADWTDACICAGPDTCAVGTYSQAFYSHGDPSNAVMRYLCLPVRVKNSSSPAPSPKLKHRHA